MALQEKKQNLYGKLATAENHLNGAVVALQLYVKLNKWHEKLVKEVPIIRKKNSGIIRVQTWEGAVE